MKDLTKEQEARIPEFKEKWIKICLSTETNKEMTVEAVKECYKAAGYEPPAEADIHWASGPKEACLKAAELAGVSPSEAWGNQIFGNHDGDWLVYWDFIHKVCQENCTAEEWAEVEKTVPLIELAQHGCWVWGHENFAVCMEKPLSISIVEGEFHKDLGPALEFKDGCKLFQLHGVTVPERLVMTPADELTGKDFLETQNVEVKRELIRKMGMHRLLSVLKNQKVDTVTFQQANIDPSRIPITKTLSEFFSTNLGRNIEKQSLTIVDPAYILYMVETGLDSRPQNPYLLMVNPSTGDIHLEGVAPECKTVEEALYFRMHGEYKAGAKYEAPAVLT